jgi:hypothetical protein
LKSPNDPEPAPVANELRPVWEDVLDDMRGRDQIGRKNYGMPLQPFNGRDPEVDEYQEALDWIVYRRQKLTERNARAWRPFDSAAVYRPGLYVLKWRCSEDGDVFESVVRQEEGGEWEGCRSDHEPDETWRICGPLVEDVAP